VQLTVGDAMIATGGNRSTSMPSPAGSGGSSATAGPSEASPGYWYPILSKYCPVSRSAASNDDKRMTRGAEEGRATEFMAHLRHIYTGGVPSPETHHSYHIVIAISLLIMVYKANPSSARTAGKSSFCNASGSVSWLAW
jgi:hypothetical protein